MNVNEQRIALCDTCVDLLRDGYRVKLVSPSKNKDIKCNVCGAQTIGGMYEIVSRRRDEEGGWGEK